MMPSSDGFVISGGDARFNDRQKQLFSQLQDAEKSFNKDKNLSLSDTDRRSPTRESTSPTFQPGRRVKKFRGRESIFKAPNAVPRNRSRNPTVPGYHRNPSKWTKYSLEDSPDVTHKSNAHAALSFLNQLRDRNKDKEPEDEQMDVEENKGEEQGPSKRNKDADRVMFKKNTRVQQPGVVEKEDKPFFRSSKLIMPELVVGEKKKKNKEKVTRKKLEDCDKTFVKLGHLDEDDGD